MGKVNIDFTPTKYSADDAPDLVTGAYNQSMDDLKIALDNATAEDGGGGDITYPIPIDKGGTNANNAADALFSLGGLNKQVVYYPSGDVLDTVLDGFCLVRVADQSSLSGITNQVFVYAMTIFYESVSETANRKQIIFGYDNELIASRSYANGSWKSWVKIANETDLANYLPLTGGTVTGIFSIKDTNHPPQLNVVDGSGNQSSLQTNSNNCKLFFVDPEVGGIQNSLYLYSDRTELKKPLTVSSGGTGANTAEQARENLGIVDPTPVYVETEETSEPGLHIIVDSENNVLKIKKV